MSQINMKKFEKDKQNIKLFFLFHKISKTDYPLAKLTTKTKNPNKIRDEKERITIDTTEVETI